MLILFLLLFWLWFLLLFLLLLLLHLSSNVFFCPPIFPLNSGSRWGHGSPLPSIRVVRRGVGLHGEPRHRRRRGTRRSRRCCLPFARRRFFVFVAAATSAATSASVTRNRRGTLLLLRLPPRRGPGRGRDGKRRGESPLALRSPSPPAAASGVATARLPRTEWRRGGSAPRLHAALRFSLGARVAHARVSSRAAAAVRAVPATSATSSSSSATGKRIVRQIAAAASAAAAAGLATRAGARSRGRPIGQTQSQGRRTAAAQRRGSGRGPHGIHEAAFTSASSTAASSAPHGAFSAPRALPQLQRGTASVARFASRIGTERLRRRRRLRKTFW